MYCSPSCHLPHQTFALIPHPTHCLPGLTVRLTNACTCAHMQVRREMDVRNRYLSDEELDAALPGEADGYAVLPPPASYKPIRTPARKLVGAPDAAGAATPGARSLLVFLALARFRHVARSCMVACGVGARVCRPRCDLERACVLQTCSPPSARTPPAAASLSATSPCRDDARICDARGERGGPGGLRHHEEH